MPLRPLHNGARNPALPLISDAFNHSLPSAANPNIAAEREKLEVLVVRTHVIGRCASATNMRLEQAARAATSNENCAFLSAKQSATVCAGKAGRSSDNNTSCSYEYALFISRRTRRCRVIACRLGGRCIILLPKGAACSARCPRLRNVFFASGERRDTEKPCSWRQ